MRHQKGLSLVELLIAITLGLVLMAGVVQMFLSSRNIFSNQQAISRSQETGRLAIEFIARDLRNAGYYGCFRPNLAMKTSVQVAPSAVGAGLHANFDSAIQGYDDISKLPDGVVADLGEASAISNSSILVIRGAGTVGAQIHSISSDTAISGYSPSSLVGSCVGELCGKAVMVASDCGKAVVFMGTSVSTTSNEVTVSHAKDWNDQSFAEGEILPFNTSVYFVAKGVAGQNSLWQRINNGSAVELLEGVEALSVTYLTTNSYLSAAGYPLLTDWSNVIAVKVEILVRSLDDKIVPSAQTVSFAGKPFTPTGSDALHLYQVFTTSVDLRNRESFSN